MGSNGKNAGIRTPVKDPQASRSKFEEANRLRENSNPNFTSPGPKPLTSPAIKSGKSQKSAPRIAKPIASPQKKIRERKFIVAKKNPEKEKSRGPSVTCKCKERNGSNVQKCVCVAYENLRASQEEFFKNRGLVNDQCNLDQRENLERSDLEVGGQNPNFEDADVGKAVEGEVKGPSNYKPSEINPNNEVGRNSIAKRGEKIGDWVRNPNSGASDEGKAEEGKANERNSYHPGEILPNNEVRRNSTGKRGREKLLEESRDSVLEPGSGKVMHLVQIFESILTIPKSKDGKEEEEDAKKGLKWALPELNPKAPVTDRSLTSLSSSDLSLTAENLGLDCNVSSSWDSSQGSFSTFSRTTSGDQRSRRNSSERTCRERNWRRRQPKVTSQKPFQLRTEQRGRQKEEEFMRKVQEMLAEEEKLRIPIAQGLPWTTDEPECLIKPPTKDYTLPLDVQLHSDVRAVERAEFDHQVAEKLSLFEQFKMERERRQKLAEEEEIRRLRRELIPKAQPMPYFDRPFIPRRSMKDLTVPKEPKLHIPHQKKVKCCLSLDDINIYNQSSI